MAEDITLPTTKFATLGNFLNYYDSEHTGRGSRHNGVSSIKYDASNPNKQFAKYDDSKWLAPLVVVLNKCGVKCENTGHFDLQMENAISEFQRKYMVDNFWYTGTDAVRRGVLCNRTMQQIISYANNMPDCIDPDTGKYIGRKPTDDDSAPNPHYDPFFDSGNTKQFRQNHKNIKIILGNSGIVKEIHDVVMRSVGVEVDTSGNPVSETYEFIARDITETDESKDADNYTGNNGVAPSDVQYKFNFKK